MGKPLEHLTDVLPLLDDVLSDLEEFDFAGIRHLELAHAKLERLRALIDTKFYECDYALDDDEEDLEELDFNKVDYSKMQFPSDE